MVKEGFPAAGRPPWFLTAACPAASVNATGLQDDLSTAQTIAVRAQLDPVLAGPGLLPTLSFGQHSVHDGVSPLPFTHVRRPVHWSTYLESSIVSIACQVDTKMALIVEFFHQFSHCLQLSAKIKKSYTLVATASPCYPKPLEQALCKNISRLGCNEAC